MVIVFRALGFISDKYVLRRTVNNLKKKIIKLCRIFAEEKSVSESQKKLKKSGRVELCIVSFCILIIF